MKTTIWGKRKKEREYFICIFKIILFRNFNCRVFVPLPIPLNENGPRILVFRFNYSTSKVHTEAIFRCVNAVPEVLIMDDPYACIQGIVFVMDMAQASANHLMQFTPSFVKKMVTYYERSLPLRIKGIYCINASPVAEQFFKLVLSLLSEKLRRRVSFYLKPSDDNRVDL